MKTPTEKSLRELVHRASENAKHQVKFTACIVAYGSPFGVQVRISRYVHEGRAVQLEGEKIVDSCDWHPLIHNASSIYTNLAELAESQGFKL